MFKKFLNNIYAKMGLAVILLALIFIYVLPVKQKFDFKFWKETEEIKDSAEEAIEDSAVSFEELEDNQDEREALIAKHKKEIKRLENELNKKVPSITELPPNDRDTLWSEIGKFIFSSRKDTIQR
jgi:peptidoglycan hydrolase CwlO-like protein